MTRLSGARASPKMSPRFEAGSVVKRIVRCPCARWRAMAQATVVLPTPPLPPTRTMRRPARKGERRSMNDGATAGSSFIDRPSSFSVAGVDADPALVLVAFGRHLPRHFLAPRADLAEGGEHLRLLAAVL